jgi:quinone-modifying oxidoreductase, subunit QmoB
MAQQDVRLGIYCAGDEEITSSLDMAALENVAVKEEKATVYRTHPKISSDEGVAIIKADIEEHKLNRIIILDRSPRTYPGLFDFGPEIMVEAVAFREFVVWTHEPNDEDTQMLAEDYIRMFAAKLNHAIIPEPAKLEVTKTVLVVGGGVAGIRTALNVSACGVKAVLVEKEESLGGWATKFSKSFPSKPPYDTLTTNTVADLIQKVENDENIEVKLNTRIEKIAGQPGEFEVTLQNGGAPEVLKAGSIVQATGWKPYNPKRLTHLGWGSENVITNVQLEKMFLEGKVIRPSDGNAPESIAIIQCAGSRDQEHLSYCSGVCCRASLKHAMQLREMYPDAKVYILYKDIRSAGQYELFYQAAQDDPGFFFTKGEVVSVKEISGGGVSIDLDETLLGEQITVNADMLVLATGMVPSTSVEDGVFAGEGEETLADAPVVEGEEAPKDEAKEANILNLEYRQGTDLPTLKYGFPDSHFVCFPYETRRTAIFAVGTVRAPMDLAQVAMDANGAALKAVQAITLIAEGEALHPRARETAFPEFNLGRCTQCKRCTEDCPFGALDEDEKGTPKPNQARCRRCGTCMGACPERIISFQNYSVAMGNNMIKSVEVPEEFDEKPRIWAFICENDAMPALERAAQKRMKMNPWVRFMPVRCLGSINLVWITNCLDAGFDGIMLIGCKHGDDYQCHFVRGSELAEYRMENVQAKLTQMALESERVIVSSVAIDEDTKLMNILEEYSEEVDDMGANPFKDF